MLGRPRWVAGGFGGAIPTVFETVGIGEVGRWDR